MNMEIDEREEDEVARETNKGSRDLMRKRG